MKQKFYHDQKAKERTFTVGDIVLVFRPGKTNKLHNQWQGPFSTVKIITEVTYQVDLGIRLKQYRTFHVNCMKLWTPPESAAFLAYDNDEEDLENVEAVYNSHTLDPHHLDIEKFKEKYKDVIQDVPGKTQIVQHDICTGDAVPIRLPLYRLSHYSQEVMREEIRTLLDQEIIRPSKSPWVAPIVLVKKKDGTQRMCVDYRKLNKVTINDPYPLPNIEDLIANIGLSKFITTLDLTKGYYQVPVNPQYREKTAFVTPYGKYEFLMMPFGLISEPSTFQKLMDGLLNVLHDFTVAYLDDIIIHTDTWENHLNHMEIVFDKLREAGLKVKERKCTFGSGSCIYLEHIVGNGLVQPMECKVEAVKTFKQPKTKKDFRSFLGLCGYYRKFIPNFSSITTPLSDLTKKSMPKQVKWNEKCDKAFIELKEVTGEEHPITFASKKLLQSERNYSAIEREALTIVQGVKYFRTYLQGSKFTIETDHNPLTQLGNLKDSHGRLVRWALSLQQYNFTIVHRSGSKNANADGLSRDQWSLPKVGGVSGIPTLITDCPRHKNNRMI